MFIEIDRKSGIPIYLQLKEEIKKLIQAGIWQVGEKIPTERDLAGQLGISRNTVSTAYHELEDEGILSSTQGRGTFVSDSDAVIRQEGRKERLLRIIDVAIEEATENGYTIDDFLAITQVRAREKKAVLSRVKIVFLECNQEQLEYYAKEIKLGSGETIIPILLNDARANREKFSQILSNADLVVSTFFHLDEVKKLVGREKIDVLGIALNPQLETIVKIARLPRGSRLAIICLSDSFVAKIKRALVQSGIDHLQFEPCTSKDTVELRQVLSSATAVVVSPNRKPEIENLAAQGQEVIEFRFLPDAGSVNAIRSALLELKNTKN